MGVAATRGWSYGATVSDPRTGEIIKGHVSLDALRVRQDYLIFEGLTSPYTTGDETPPALSQVALAPVRQLGAHEVGHTLGFGHNYYSSTAGRISVMDYPAPLVTLRADGSPDLSDAYAVGIGEWDKVAVRYAYGDASAGPASTAARETLLKEAAAKDLRYLSDQDTDYNPRVESVVAPHGAGRGVDACDEGTTCGARSFRRYCHPSRVPDGADGRRVDAAVPAPSVSGRIRASALGGLHYIYAVRGDGEQGMRPVPATEQKAALEALAATLRSSELVVPKAVLDTLAPRPSGYPRHRELFPRYTGLVFDPITPGLMAADVTITAVLDPERAARIASQQAYDASLPSLDAVIGRLITAVFDDRPVGAYQALVKQAVERALVDRLITLAGQAPKPAVRAVATANLRRIQARERVVQGPDTAHARLIAADIARFLERPQEPARPVVIPSVPPGAPIGSAEEDWSGLTPRGDRSGFFAPLVR